MTTTKIELNEQEQNAIKLYLNGKVDAFNTPPEMMALFSSIIDKAQTYFMEIMPEEPIDDLIKWYYEQYKQQNESREKSISD